MKIPLKEIQDFDGNMYVLVVASIKRCDELIEESNASNSLFKEDKFISKAFSDILLGDYKYTLEE